MNRLDENHGFDAGIELRDIHLPEQRAKSPRGIFLEMLVIGHRVAKVMSSLVETRESKRQKVIAAGIAAMKAQDAKKGNRTPAIVKKPLYMELLASPVLLPAGLPVIAQEDFDEKDPIVYFTHLISSIFFNPTGRGAQIQDNGLSLTLRLPQIGSYGYSQNFQNAMETLLPKMRDAIGSDSVAGNLPIVARGIIMRQLETAGFKTASIRGHYPKQLNFKADGLVELVFEKSPDGL